ncbi:uncharacterized protein LAESUDRAFT_754826 [Laetiporus sulphureus 93-53]|uniref:Uncharacterized protein n=1 Tax=Laetiporus sulphureus 93-53 TaxID=1314785 RepID=A0A165H220_9APHY|nr:uncharacterized protein LAESUDRAFT_754826 [Laetiporus sulphureus 93-53]KZT11136.1 hypothetical protein LAESUDRAFT_754826 [Laetiporus sulphureus 93-53]
MTSTARNPPRFKKMIPMQRPVFQEQLHERRRHFEELQRLQPIKFSEPRQAYPGVSLVSLDRQYHFLDPTVAGELAPVFDFPGVTESQIVLHIKWPGYSYIQYRTIDLREGGVPITRRKLAEKVATGLIDYTLQEATSHAGWRDAPHQWRLAIDLLDEHQGLFISYKNLRLTGLTYCHDNIFIPDVYCVTDAEGTPVENEVPELPIAYSQLDVENLTLVYATF